MSDWTLATVDQATACWSDGYHVLHIRGTTPTPCYQVDLVRSLLKVEPPAFIAQRRPTGGICPEVITPYEYREAFDVGERREELTLHSDGGEMTLPVGDCGDTGGVAVVSRAHDPLSGRLLETGEAIGYSRSWNFTEAFRDAVAALGPPANFAAYEVVATGAEIGGIIGANHMWVRVKRSL